MRWFASMMAGIAALCVFGASPAKAQDYNIEAILAKIHAANTEGEIDYDFDGNLIDDLAHARLVERVLETDTAPQHVLILATYTLNRLRLDQDNTLTFQCAILQNAYDISCDEVEMFGAAYFTIGNLEGVEAAIEPLVELGLNINVANYNLTMSQYLDATGDLDGDGFTNRQEYNAVCKDAEQFVVAAMDPGLTPVTVPCCINCPLAVTTQPQDATKYAGDPHTFTVAVTGADGELGFQWQKNNQNIPGQTSAELSFGALAETDSGFYRCAITDAQETITSRSALLVVKPHAQITQQPQSATKLVGQTHQFSVTATGGAAPLIYQWRKAGTNIGTSANVLSFGSLELGDAGTYDVLIGDGIESITSDAATLTVLPRLLITQLPQGARKYVGDSHTFTIATSGGIAPPTYTWLKGTTTVGTGGELTLSPLATTNAGTYFCKVTDGVDTLFSAGAKLEVANHMRITRQPAGVTVTEGDALNLRVDVTGGYTPLVYAWTLNDQPIAVATNRINIAAATQANAGTYVATISDGFESITSNAAVVVVNPIVVEEGEGDGDGIADGEGGPDGAPDGEGTPDGAGDGEGEPDGSVDGEGDGTADGEGTIDGAADGEGDGALEGEGSADGAPDGEGDGTADGEGNIEGASDGEGSVDGTPDGEGSADGEGATDGAAEGEAELDGEGVAEGEGGFEGEGLLEGEGMTEGEGEGGGGPRVAIIAAADATLYEDANGAIANGSGDYFFVGRNANNQERRALLRFDVASALPRNIEVLSATLQLNLSKTNAAQEIACHRVTRAWTEGGSDADGEEGGGAPSQAGDATWVHSQYDTTRWRNAGGDFDAEPLFIAFAPGVGEMEFAADTLNALVQDWARRPLQNNGILLRPANSGAGTSQRFDTTENDDPTVWPRLVIEYQLVDLEGEDEGEGDGSEEGEGAADGEGAIDGEGVADGEGEPDPNMLIAQDLLNNFDARDTDGDGTISFEEALAANPDMPLTTFAELDGNDDGELSRRELLEFTGAPLGKLDVGTAPIVGLEFERVVVGEEEVVELTASNIGNAPITVYLSLPNIDIDEPTESEGEGGTVISTNSVFSINEEPITIEAGASAVVPVTFAPEEFVEYQGSLVLDTRDGVPAVAIPLIGAGVLIDIEGGCFASPDGGGDTSNLQIIITVIVVLVVLALTISRLQTP